MINTYEGHQFCSESRAYTKISCAFCECGVEYDWIGREEQHDRHVFAMIWEEGYRAALIAPQDNPYEAGR